MLKKSLIFQFYVNERKKTWRLKEEGTDYFKSIKNYIWAEKRVVVIPQCFRNMENTKEAKRNRKLNEWADKQYSWQKNQINHTKTS